MSLEVGLCAGSHAVTGARLTNGTRVTAALLSLGTSSAPDVASQVISLEVRDIFTGEVDKTIDDLVVETRDGEPHMALLQDDPATTQLHEALADPTKIVYPSNSDVPIRVGVSVVRLDLSRTPDGAPGGLLRMSTTPPCACTVRGGTATGILVRDSSVNVPPVNTELTHSLFETVTTAEQQQQVYDVPGAALLSVATGSTVVVGGSAALRFGRDDVLQAADGAAAARVAVPVITRVDASGGVEQAFWVCTSEEGVTEGLFPVHEVEPASERSTVLADANASLAGTITGVGSGGELIFTPSTALPARTTQATVTGDAQGLVARLSETSAWTLRLGWYDPQPSLRAPRVLSLVDRRREEVRMDDGSMTNVAVRGIEDADENYTQVVIGLAYLYPNLLCGAARAVTLRVGATGEEETLRAVRIYDGNNGIVRGTAITAIARAGAFGAIVGETTVLRPGSGAVCRGRGAAAPRRGRLHVRAARAEYDPAQPPGERGRGRGRGPSQRARGLRRRGHAAGPRGVGGPVPTAAAPMQPRRVHGHLPRHRRRRAGPALRAHEPRGSPGPALRRDGRRPLPAAPRPADHAGSGGDQRSGPRGHVRPHVRRRRPQHHVRLRLPRVGPARRGRAEPGTQRLRQRRPAHLRRGPRPVVPLDRDSSSSPPAIVATFAPPAPAAEAPGSSLPGRDAQGVAGTWFVQDMRTDDDETSVLPTTVVHLEECDLLGVDDRTGSAERLVRTGRLTLSRCSYAGQLNPVDRVRLIVTDVDAAGTQVTVDEALGDVGAGWLLERPVARAVVAAAAGEKQLTLDRAAPSLAAGQTLVVAERDERIQWPYAAGVPRGITRRPPCPRARRGGRSRRPAMPPSRRSSGGTGPTRWPAAPLQPQEEVALENVLPEIGATTTAGGVVVCDRVVDRAADGSGMSASARAHRATPASAPTSAPPCARSPWI